MNDAKIIAVTQPLIEDESFYKLTSEEKFNLNNLLIGGKKYLNAEEFIAYPARVSNPSNQYNTLTAPKLLKYLIEHKHWSGK